MPITMPQATMIQTGAQVAGQLIGMIGQRAREERALGHQKELMDLQAQNQMKLNKQGQEIQLDTWKKTSYPAQMEMLKQAGLNPALMYGTGGQGGTTTGSQGGGSATGGFAPAPQYMPLDIASAMRTTAELKLLEAQTKNIEADTKKKLGVDTEEAQSRINVNNGIISLNLSQEQLNKATQATKENEIGVQNSVKKLNEELAKFNDQKIQESIVDTQLNQKTLDWMKETGLNPADSSVAKVLNYLGRQTGIAEDTLIYLIGGAIGVKELMKMLPQQLISNLIKKAPNAVKGFGK